MTTRYLTADEIEDIISFIKPVKGIPIDSAISIANNNKERFRKQLKKQKLFSDIIPKLKELLQKTYIETLINPGESVGIICAQSIGEKNTQSMLNTYRGTKYSKN
jgi:hypothetical protein